MDEGNRGPVASNILLIWYQRQDGYWNAECTCGATICGTRDDQRDGAELWHFAQADSARAQGNKYLPCGPKIPEPNPNLPGPYRFR